MHARHSSTSPLAGGNHRCNSKASSTGNHRQSVRRRNVIRRTAQRTHSAARSRRSSQPHASRSTLKRARSGNCLESCRVSGTCLTNLDHILGKGRSRSCVPQHFISAAFVDPFTGRCFKAEAALVHGLSANCALKSSERSRSLEPLSAFRNGQTAIVDSKFHTFHQNSSAHRIQQQIRIPDQRRDLEMSTKQMASNTGLQA